jgi:uncharacterized membrane protein YphA (DoxX/SURF4 family)
MSSPATAKTVLTISLALVFAFFGLGKFTDPFVWIGWMPLWMDGLLGQSKETWMRVIGSIEIVTAILLIVPKRKLQRIGCALAIVQLIGILSQVGFNDVGIRDGAILLSAVALFLLL